MPKNKIIKKEVNDKFYTKPSIAEYCFEKLKEFCLPTDLYIEPSAGNGSFYNLLPEGSIGIDIVPENSSIVKCDFFEFVVPDGYENITIIGNPPFGNRNALTKAFIEKSSTFATTIAFVLPEVFEKSIMQKVVPKDFKLIFSERLPEGSFLLNDEEYNVYSVFQIWTKVLVDGIEDLRKKYVIPSEACDFKFVGKNEPSDFFVFGSAPTKCIKPEDVLPNNRGYFVKVKEHIPVNSVIAIFQNNDWKKIGKSSVNGGVFWLTKQELVDGYNFFAVGLLTN